MRNSLIAALVILALLAICFFAGRWSYHPAEPEPVVIEKTVHDTTYIDTLVVEVAAAPCYITRTEKVYVPVPILDSVARDTVYAEMERVTKRYEDSTFTAVISGIEPNLDSMTVYPRKQVITINTVERNTVPPPKWGIGVQAGLGVLYDGGFHAGPYIGLGVTYRF